MARLAFLPLLLLPALMGCSTIGEIDAAMRRVDVLDRVFGAPPPPPPPAPAPPPDPGPPKAAEAEPLTEPMNVPTVDVEPAPAVVAPAPAVAAQAPAAADPARRRAALIRDYPWLTRFWAELNAEQQGRVRRALARRGVSSDPAGLWDPLGLNERVRLVFGEG
ncbi:hypothetical protein [Falsiroseomonas sp. HW251]|uniref:hypothetical protein n=1 Tax=Falsiroseomonas sp. HW251 TaxID=3390998 RepID=UPI003D3151D3